MVGSMRPATATSADGPGNIYNGVAVAISPEASGKGTLVSLNDEFHYARNVVKTNTTSLQTFESLNRGPAGLVHTGTVEWFEPMDKKLGKATGFNVEKLDKLPRVDVIYAHANMSADLIEAAIKNGAKGIVIAGVGDGNMTSPALDACKKAAADGIVVVRSTRLPEGLVLRNNEVNDDEMGFVASGEFNPAQVAGTAAACADPDQGSQAYPGNVLRVLMTGWRSPSTGAAPGFQFTGFNCRFTCTASCPARSGPRGSGSPRSGRLSEYPFHARSREYPYWCCRPPWPAPWRAHSR